MAVGLNTYPDREGIETILQIHYSHSQKLNTYPDREGIETGGGCAGGG